MDIKELIDHKFPRSDTSCLIGLSMDVRMAAIKMNGSVSKKLMTKLCLE